MKEKQTNEQRMLFRLNDVFNSPIPRNRIRMVVRAAFERMWAEAQDLRACPRVMGALVAEGNLAVWVKTGTGTPHHRQERTLASLRLGTAANPQLDCNDFSGLIRVAGAWLELMAPKLIPTNQSDVARFIPLLPQEFQPRRYR